MDVQSRPTSARHRLRRVRDELHAAYVLRQAGFLRLDPPRRLAAIARAGRRYGPMGSATIAAALRHPNRVAILDEDGPVTYAELDRRSNAVANAWQARGVRAGTTVAMLVRNHRGFYDAFFATQKLGARTVLLNTDFAGPQLREVATREGTEMLAYDPEFEPLVGELGLPLGAVTDWTDHAGHDEGSPPPAPGQHGSIVILTSGTTGTPKGANRGATTSLTPMAALLGAVRFPAGGTTVIAAPLFHSLGLVTGAVAVGLGSTQILRRRFDPGAVLDALAEHHAEAIVLVPIMLKRLIDEQERAPRDVSTLRIALVAGSQLGAPLAQRATSVLGDVVHNLYGSTEVAFATIARPEHLRVDPSTVGPATLGTRLRIVDDAGRPVPAGTTGRIVVGNAIPFEGYTGGGGKPIVGGLLSSGDVGHLDARGLLYIDGRDDAMIVSGGENVFPDEIESLLAGHPEIADAAAIGVDDDTYGQRLSVFVVLRDNATLDEDGVRDYVRQNLARFKVPRDVVFLDHLPRNPTGKVLKRELAPT
ncbi:MAG TPA: AMP-binding protein [Solirubrobacteraceae bacterium]|nr:AMP-binding protein [Solirubrobacteraceae bacterium]